MSEQKTHTMNFIHWLTLAFIVLKLCNVITWSWWWVLSPMLLPLGFAMGCLVLACVLYVMGDPWRKKE